MLYQSEFVKKTIRQQSCEDSKAKKPLSSDLLKNLKGGPFDIKKIFICILNLNMIPMLEVRGVNLHESLSCLRLTWDAKMWWNVEIFRRAKFLGLQIWV